MLSKNELEILLAQDEMEHPYGAASPAIHPSSTFVFKDYAALEARYNGDSRANIYSRTENPTVAELERKLAKLEQGEAAIAFGSGMAAISSSILALVNAGDTVLCVENVYSDAYRFFELFLRRFAVSVEYVDCTDLDALDEKLGNAKLLYLESPNSFMFESFDLKAIADLAKKHDVTTVLDNSFASPMLQNPLLMGFDLVAHSASKYLSGHSDIVAGCVMGRTELIEQIRNHSLSLLGGKLSAMEAWLIMRGLRTLGVRLREHGEAADFIADGLKNNPYVANIYRPGFNAPLPEGLRGAGGLITIELQEHVDIAAFCDGLKVVRLGVSWGGFESLALPASIAKRSDQGPNAMHKFDVPNKTIRVFCGLEGREAILSDIRDALASAVSEGT